MIPRLRGFSSYLLCGCLIVLVSWTLHDEFMASNRLKSYAVEEFLKIEVLAKAIQEDANRVQGMVNTSQAQLNAVIASNREVVSAAHDELLMVLSPENRWRVEVMERLQAMERKVAHKETP